jgi:hypothetical protein
MIKVFLSYSHEDEPLRIELNKHLAALRHEKIIDAWCDQQIPVGSNWSKEISNELETADLILLLVSPSFLNSPYCYLEEMRRAVARHNAGQALVVPIILRPCYWEPAPFSKIQGLPKGMVPVTAAPNERRDDVWAEIARGIHEAATICDTRKGNDMRTSDNNVVSGALITVTGMLSVDEVQLEAVVRQFKKGDKVSICWPKSSDQLISLVKEVIRKFDAENIESIGGSNEFIRSAPPALRDTFGYRSKVARRLPELMSILSDFGRAKDRSDLEQWYVDCRVDAIKYYLLLSNYFGHWQLGYLSGWLDLKDLNLRPPDAWIPYQGIMKDEEFYAKLYGREWQRISSIRLYEIGKYKVSDHRDPGYITVKVPRADIIYSPRANDPKSFLDKSPTKERYAEC